MTLYIFHYKIEFDYYFYALNIPFIFLTIFFSSKMFIQKEWNIQNKRCKEWIRNAVFHSFFFFSSFQSFVANLTLLIDNEPYVCEYVYVCLFNRKCYVRRKKDEAMQINGVVGIALCLRSSSKQQTAAAILMASAHRKSSYISWCYSVGTGVYLHSLNENVHILSKVCWTRIQRRVNATIRSNKMKCIKPVTQNIYIYEWITKKPSGWN